MRHEPNCSELRLQHEPSIWSGLCSIRGRNWPSVCEAVFPNSSAGEKDHMKHQASTFRLALGLAVIAVACGESASDSGGSGGSSAVGGAASTTGGSSSSGGNAPSTGVSWLPMSSGRVTPPRSSRGTILRARVWQRSRSHRCRSAEKSQDFLRLLPRRNLCGSRCCPSVDVGVPWCWIPELEVQPQCTPGSWSRR